MITIIENDKDEMDDKNHLSDSEDEFNIDYDDETQLSKLVLDFSLDETIRYTALRAYYNIHSDNAVELISRLTGMYQFSGTKIIQTFLIRLCSPLTNISSFLKLECAKGLLSFNEYEEREVDPEKDAVLSQVVKESNEAIRERNKIRNEIGYKALYDTCGQLYKDDSYPTPCKVDAIINLMEVDTYKTEAYEFFRYIIDLPNIEVDFRYKIILSLENATRIRNKTYYLTRAHTDFLNNTSNQTMYRILSAQYLLVHKDNDKDKDKDKHEDYNGDEMEFVFDSLFVIATTKTNEYNLRADAADTILKYGSDKQQEHAREIIDELAEVDGVVRNIYQNAQNVHTKDVETSIEPLIEFLMQVDNPDELVFDDVRVCISEFIEDMDADTTKHNIKKIKASLNRIDIDRALYSKFSCSISNILVKLWCYILTNPHKEFLLSRLFEELEDMSGTCSSGFMARLVNTISGFEGLNIKISFSNQIVANFTGRLNMYAKKIKDKDSVFRNDKLKDVKELYARSSDVNVDSESLLEFFEEQVFNEMTEPTDNFVSRRYFLMFFREHMLGIREELYEEFKDFVSDSEFDLSFRKAISSYEGVQHLA